MGRSEFVTLAVTKKSHLSHSFIIRRKLPVTIVENCEAANLMTAEEDGEVIKCVAVGRF
jgi:hypothetical protein